MPVSSGIIDFAFHPPLATLTPHLDPAGPYGAGNHQITSVSGTPVSQTFGLLIRMAVLNSHSGYIDGFVSSDGLVDGNVYLQWLVQVGVQHQLGSGAWVLTQLANVDNPFMPVLWDVALPGRIGLYVPPLNSVDLYFLRVG